MRSAVTQRHPVRVWHRVLHCICRGGRASAAGSVFRVAAWAPGADAEHGRARVLAGGSSGCRGAARTSQDVPIHAVRLSSAGLRPLTDTTMLQPEPCSTLQGQAIAGHALHAVCMHPHNQYCTHACGNLTAEPDFGVRRCMLLVACACVYIHVVQCPFAVGGPGQSQARGAASAAGRRRGSARAVSAGGAAAHGAVHRPWSEAAGGGEALGSRAAEMHTAMSPEACIAGRQCC